MGFHPERIKTAAPEIAQMLNELPRPFHVEGGGGWSFLQACQDRHGNQWTGMHRTMELLFLMGLALGKVKECLPREHWTILPGGVPYYTVIPGAST